jgi:hypothetical protein
MLWFIYWIGAFFTYGVLVVDTEGWPGHIAAVMWAALWPGFLVATLGVKFARRFLRA